MSQQVYSYLIKYPRKMPDNGWIKVHRKLQGKGYYKKSEYVHLWLHLLLSVNHKPKEFLWNGSLIKVDAGQILTGRTVLADETGINESKIERILKVFENEHQIEQQKTTKFRIITLVNWKNHQKIKSSEQQNEQQLNNKRTTTEQQLNTNNNDNNDKKEKNDKNKALSPNGDFLSQIIDIFQTEYKDCLGLEYIITNKGKERSAAGKLLSAYNEKNKGSNSEKCLNDFSRLFKAICSADYTKNNFLAVISLSKISNYINDYMQFIKGKERTYGSIL